MTSDGSLRFASYNTRDFLDDPRAAAHVVRRVGPDVLCLQEVPRHLGAVGRVRRFADECGLRPAGRHRGSGGTTVLIGDRVDLTSSGHHRLPVRFLSRTRGYAVAHLRAHGWPPLTVVSVHLGLQPQQRVHHLQLVLAAAHGARAALSAGAPGVMVLAGDLNEGEDGDAYALLAQTLTRVSPAIATFPVWEPRHVLDVVFATPGVQVVPGPETVLPDDLVRAASDHRPVWVDLAPPTEV